MLLSLLLKPNDSEVLAHRMSQTPIDMAYFFSLIHKGYNEEKEVLLASSASQQHADIWQVNCQLWLLMREKSADFNHKPLTVIDGKKLKSQLESMHREIIMAHLEGKKLFNDLTWAMLSYLDHYNADEDATSTMSSMASTHLLLNKNDIGARLFLLRTDFSGCMTTEEFLLPLCASKNPWVTLSVLSSSSVNVATFTQQMRDGIAGNIYLALEHLATFKVYAFLEEEDCVTLLRNMVRLSVLDKLHEKASKGAVEVLLNYLSQLIRSKDMSVSQVATDVLAIVGYNFLIAFKDNNWLSAGEDLAYAFEEEAIRFIRHRGVLAAMLQIEVKGETNHLMALFDHYAQHLGFRFYNTLFSAFKVDTATNEYIDPAVAKIMPWVFSLKCMREFNFITSVSNYGDVFEVIVGLNNSQFNNLLFENNYSLDAKDGVNYTFSSQLKPVGSKGEDDEACGVHPLYAALAAFNLGENASEVFRLGVEQLILKMLSDTQFKISHYFGVKGSGDFFNSLPQVKLADQLHRLLGTRHELLADADYECPSEVDVDLVDLLIRQCYVAEIHALVEHPEKSIEARRLAAIMAIVDQLPVERKVALYDDAPHFILLSLANNICECVTAIGEVKEKVSSVTMFSKMKNTIKKPSEENKIARVHLLTYIKNHLSQALHLAAAGKPTFMYMAYYAVNRMAGANLEPAAMAKAMLNDSTLAPGAQRNVDAGYAGDDSSDALVNDWLSKTIFVKSASTLSLIAMPLALLPDDYLDGILQRTNITKQQIRKMAFPKLAPEVFENQKVFMAAAESVRRSTLAEDAKVAGEEVAPSRVSAAVSAQALVARTSNGDSVVGSVSPLPKPTLSEKVGVAPTVSR